MLLMSRRSSHDVHLNVHPPNDKGYERPNAAACMILELIFKDTHGYHTNSNATYLLVLAQQPPWTARSIGISTARLAHI